MTQNRSFSLVSLTKSSCPPYAACRFRQQDFGGSLSRACVCRGVVLFVAWFRMQTLGLVWEPHFFKRFLFSYRKLVHFSLKISWENVVPKLALSGGFGDYTTTTSIF